MFNMDEDQNILQTPMMDSDYNRADHNSDRNYGQFKLVKGKDDPTTFLPFSQKLGEIVRKQKSIEMIVR